MEESYDDFVVNTEIMSIEISIENARLRAIKRKS